MRDALGVRFSDNLQNARMVFLVEGTDDALALRAIISARSDILKEAIGNGIIAFDHLGGASSLRQKASFYQAGTCLVQCFIDDDKAGRAAVERAIDDKVLTLRDINLCKVPHLKESELEDIYDKSVYASEFNVEFGVDPTKKPLGKPNIKWTNVIERLFNEAGKPWNERVKYQVKKWVAAFAADNARNIIKEPLSGPIDSFITTAESKLPKN